MKSSLAKKSISLFIAVLMAVGMVTPAITAFADDGVIGYYDIEIFNNDGILVPDKNEDDSNYIIYLEEGQSMQFKYELVDCSMPNNGSVKWYSEEPGLVSVDQNGLVRGHDSSKGAVVHEWIDNDVKTIPLVGKIMGKALDSLLFNDNVDVDTMDTDAIVALISGYFDTSLILNKYASEYKDVLLQKLKDRLDSVNSNIHVTLYKADGTVADDDVINVVVTKSTEAWADLIPNGTHITNKDSVNTTVAVGSTAQIYAVTTPVRLHMGVVYSTKNSSIISNGKVIATVDDSGLVTFKNKGTVTIVVSPDTEGFINNLLKYINYVYALDNTGTINTDKVADVLIKVLGLDMNRQVLASILDVCFAIYDIAGDAADPVQLTATAVEILANFVYQFTTNDTITFNVVDGQPCTDFNIDGTNTVQEGNQIQLAITDAKPDAADTSDITWSSSDPSIASVDPNTGIITGRDAGGSLGALSSQSVEITATSAANNVSKTFAISVTGKTGRYLSDADIVANQNVTIDSQQDMTFNAYPSRVASANNIYHQWGVVTGGTDAESYTYEWATDPYTTTETNAETGEETTVSHDGSVTDGIGTVNKEGHYTATNGGTCKVALKVYTGYYISDTNFYEISSVITTKDICNGVPVSDINLTATGTTSGGNMSSHDTDFGTYVTVKKTVADGYWLNGATLKAEVLPATASNKNVKWYAEGSNDFSLEPSSDTQTCDVKMKAGVEAADSVTVYAKSEDGRAVSKPITISVTRNYATGNTIDKDSYEFINGKAGTVTHTMTFSGSWTSGAYACYDCNWFSSNEEVFSVKNSGNDNNDATITASGVGKATIYCVSADGGIVDSAEVVVKPDKEYLKEVVNVCENTVVRRTDENKTLYRDYMKKLDYCYYLIDEEMAEQSACDYYARELLMSFYRLGAFIGLNSISITDKTGAVIDSNYLSVKVDTTLYTNTSYDLGYVLNPKKAMYKSITWSSSSDSVSVDKNGVCKPTSNSACYSTITVTATDYMGATVKDSVVVAFVKTQATGIELDTQSISAGKVGETKQVTATVLPSGTLGVGARSIDDVFWTSSNNEIASVDSKGVITFNRGGDCVITATSCDGGFAASLNVNVVTNYDALQGQVNTYNTLSLDQTSYFPESWDAFQNNIAESQAMIDANASSQDEVDAMLAKLVASYEGLKKYNKIQKVELYLDGEPASEFYQYNLALLSEGVSYKNAKLDLNVRLYPSEECNYKSVQWIPSTSDITVTKDGVCSPSENKSCYGKVTVRVTDHFGDVFEDSVYVSFAFTPVTGVTIDSTTIAGAIGDTHQLAATIEPVGTSLLGIGKASIQDYYWWSEDESIATVDSNGLVTFKSTGATYVHATSYDGGVTGDCLVSTNGDRSALEQALATYKNTDCTDYQYDYGMAFKNAYDEASSVMNDNSKTQDEIDAAATNLVSAGEALAGHDYVRVTDIVFSYEDWNYSFGWKSKGTGTIDNNYHTREAYSSTVRSNTRVSVKATTYPENAMYKSINMTELAGESRSTETLEDGAFALKPSGTLSDCYDVLQYTVTDDWGRTYSENVTICIPKTAVTGLSLDKSALNTTVAAGATTINATLSPSSPTYQNIIWTSSNEDVATVENGVVTPKNTGSAVITATTLDGGFTASCNVTVSTDFSKLATAYGEGLEYFNQVDNDNTHTYTKASMAEFNQALKDAATMINENTANQGAVDEMVAKIASTKAALVQFVGMDSVDAYKTTAGEDGFYYYNNVVSVTGTIQLKYVVAPAEYKNYTVEWSSDNADITVDENGLVKNNGSTTGYAKITATAKDEFGTPYTDVVYCSFSRVRVSSITFENESITGNVGTTQSAPASVNATASIQKVIYTSANPDVATIDENGEVSFVSAGSTTITAYAVESGRKATMAVISKGDTSALEAAIATGDSIVYTNYESAYGSAFKTAYDNAKAVLADVSSSQTNINDACTALVEATNNLAGHELVPVSALAISYNGAEIEDNEKIVANSGDTITLNPSIKPANASYNVVKWSIDGVSSVTAEQSGEDYNITLNSNGGWADVTLAVTDDYGTDKEITKHIFVCDKFVQSVSFDSTEISKNYGDSNFTLTPVITPSDAAIKDVKWSTSDESIATVDDNGEVSIVGSGTATITATTVDGGFTANMVVKIAADFSELRSIYNMYSEMNLNESDYVKSTFTAFTTALTSAKAVLDNAESSQASINQAKDNLKDAYDGLVIYTGITSAGIVDSTGEIKQYIRTQSTLALNGKTVQLGVKVNPSDAVCTTTWDSSNKDEITVDENGLVTCGTTNACTAKITAVVTDDRDNSITTYAYVSFVRNPATSVTFDSETVYGPVNSTKTITPVVKSSTGLNADTKTCTYYSADETVATVTKDASASATVTFLKTGQETTIYAVSCDGGIVGSITAYCTNDTAALQSAVDEYASVDYKTFAYSYGMAFKAAYENAQSVLSNMRASQDAINTACDELVTAYNNGVANPYVALEGFSLSANSKELSSYSTVEMGDNSSVDIVASYTSAFVQKNITWTCEGDGVSYLQNGNTLTVTKTKDYAEAEITATVTDEYGKEFSTSSTVVLTKVAIQSATLPQTEVNIDLAESNTYQLNPTILPANATNKEITWVSIDNSIATVDDNGLVTFHKAGTITIGGLTKDGAKELTCKFVVSNSGFTVAVTQNNAVVETTSVTLKRLSSVTANFGYLVTPAGKEIDTVKWSSDNTNVTVADDGTATFKAYPTGTGYTAVLTVTVTDKNGVSTSGSVTVSCAR